jgi:hypothetical protein
MLATAAFPLRSKQMCFNWFGSILILTQHKYLMNPLITSHSLAFRKPMRISITVSFSTCQQLLRMSGEQGRSVSNLAAFLIEGALTNQNC